MQLPVYLDHAATTPVLPAILEAMTPYFTDFYGNPSALHQVGMAARNGVDEARETLAELLNASPDEIVFTSGGTEADNAAIFGVARASGERGRHLLTTKTEHHAVLEPFETLAREGWEVEYVPTNAEGRVSLAEVASRLRSDTTLVSIMAANNEIGTTQPIAEIGALCRSHGVRLHTDAVQAFGRVPLDVRAMKIDMLSLSAHKFYGPKGIGALYVRRGTPLQRFQEGGAQEKGRRGGTLNVPGIVGLAKAARIAHSDMETEDARFKWAARRFHGGSARYDTGRSHHGQPDAPFAAQHPFLRGGCGGGADAPCSRCAGHLRVGGVSVFGGVYGTLARLEGVGRTARIGTGGAAAHNGPRHDTPKRWTTR